LEFHSFDDDELRKKIIPEHTKRSRFTAATLARLSDGQTLEASQVATVLTIPDHAQGAAIGGGGLWIARSDWNWGTLDQLDPVECRCHGVRNRSA
jgi:hypothetical protein